MIWFVILMGVEKIVDFFGGSVVRWFGGSDSIKNNSVYDTHNFLWKIGGFYYG